MIDLFEEYTLDTQWNTTMALIDYYEKQYYLEAETPEVKEEPQKKEGAAQKVVNALRKLFQILRNTLRRVRKKVFNKKSNQATTELEQTLGHMSDSEKKGLLNKLKAGKGDNQNQQVTTEAANTYNANNEELRNSLDKVTKKSFFSYETIYKLNHFNRSLDKGMTILYLITGGYMGALKSIADYITRLMIEEFIRTYREEQRSNPSRLPSNNDVINTGKSLIKTGNKLGDAFTEISASSRTNLSDIMRKNKTRKNLLKDGIYDNRADDILTMVNFIEKVKSTGLFNRDKMTSQSTLTKEQEKLIKQLVRFRRSINLSAYNAIIDNIDQLCERFDKIMGDGTNVFAYSNDPNTSDDLLQQIFSKLKPFVTVCNAYMQSTSTLIRLGDECSKITLTTIKQYK